MATTQIDSAIRHLRRAVLREDGAGKTDGQLLASFIEQEDETAFEALVHRHGPMVFGACLRIVGNHHDAEDAFQATFLVLARKASSVRPRERVANWLHGVALRTAMKAKTLALKRHEREKQVTQMPEVEAAQQDQWRDLQPLLDQELNGLPENYRLPIVLCDLEGKAIKEATRQLGWPQGTLAGRLARGRKLLAKRLANRGVEVPAGSLATVVLPNVASAGVPTSLISSTVKAATTIAVVPAQVAVLTEGVMKSMMLTKMSKALAGLVVLGAVVFGGGLLSYRTASAQQKENERGGDRPATTSQSDELERDAGAKQVTDMLIGGKEAPTGKLLSGASPKGKAMTDLDRLQGVWSVVSIQRAGGKPSRLKEPYFFMVDGKRACWQARDGEMQGGLYLDPTSKPKGYDLAMSNRTIEGIYLLEGDTLRLCYDMGWESKRPGGFKTEKGSAQFLVVLKRIHGREFFPCRLPDGTRVFPTLVDRENSAPPAPARPVPQPAADNTAQTPGAYSAGRIARVGNIIIVGNTRTEQSAILEMIPLYPGAVLDDKSLRTARKKLAAINATITVEENGDNTEYKDIRVTVKEK
jgi:RNA polymerase sigma factor (sigma-70 family)